MAGNYLILSINENELLAEYYCQSNLRGLLSAHWPRRSSRYFASSNLSKLAPLLMFYGYAALGLLAAFLYRRLPRDHSHAANVLKAALGPSRNVVYKLAAALFSLDAFGGGFVVNSLLALWLFERFNLSLAAASRVLFRVGPGGRDLASQCAAGGRAHRPDQHHGVYAHPGQHGCLIAAAFCPNVTVGLGASPRARRARRWTCQRAHPDVMSVMTPERTAAASVTAVLRSLASSISLATPASCCRAVFRLPLVVCGCLKVGYDLALLRMFRTPNRLRKSTLTPAGSRDQRISRPAIQ